MKNQKNITEFINTISSMVPHQTLQEIIPELACIDQEFWQPFTVLVVFGYDLPFVFDNYKNFHEYSSMFNFDYNVTIRHFCSVTLNIELPVSVKSFPPICSN